MHFLKQPNPEKLAGKFRERKIGRCEFNTAAAKIVSLPFFDPQRKAPRGLSCLTSP